jgi:hypothetical protein
VGVTIVRIPWSALRARTLPDQADDIAEHYARELATVADGEARWLLQVMGTGFEPGDGRAVRSVLAKALVRAAIKLEASCS